MPWLDVDQKWINDTGAGVLIQANVQGNNITVTLWGTRTRNIHAVKGPGRNVVQPKTILDARPGCVAQAPTPGFDVTAPQIFRNNEAHVRSVRFDTRSIPQDTVTCTHPAP